MGPWSGRARLRPALVRPLQVGGTGPSGDGRGHGGRFPDDGGCPAARSEQPVKRPAAQRARRSGGHAHGVGLGRDDRGSLQPFPARLGRTGALAGGGMSRGCARRHGYLRNAGGRHLHRRAGHSGSAPGDAQRVKRS